MNRPDIIANQRRHFLEFVAALRPHWRHDSAMPRRIKELLGRNRSLGSRDRRLYRELLYTALRFLPWIEPLLDSRPDDAVRLAAWLAPELKATHAFRAATCAGWPEPAADLAGRAAQLGGLIGHRPDPLALLPAWFADHCPAAFAPAELAVLLARAPLWVRLQTADRDRVLDEFRARQWEPRPHSSVADAFRLPPDADVAATDAYRRGFVEIQDIGSQLVLLHAPVVAGQRWLDACAGAGGKTLQLARLVGPSGRVEAADIRPETLVELRTRADRARLANVATVVTPGTGYDAVLVDAPCSGSGTWRRQPHLKWYTQPDMIPKFAATQLRILAENAGRVRPGGLLVYATCSLSRIENREVVAAFLEAHPGFAVEPAARDWSAATDGRGHTLLPSTHDSDGFYVALLRRGPA